LLSDYFHAYNGKRRKPNGKAAAKRVFSRLTTKSPLPLLSNYFHAYNGNRRKTDGKVGLITNIQITIRKTRGLNSDDKANDNSTRQC